MEARGYVSGGAGLSRRLPSQVTERPQGQEPRAASLPPPAPVTVPAQYIVDSPTVAAPVLIAFPCLTV